MNTSRVNSHAVLMLTLCLLVSSHSSPAEARPAADGVQDSVRRDASKRLDGTGVQLFQLEKRASDQASGRPFFEDPEDAQSARATFFMSSEKVLGLAVLADSTNASAWYHWAQVAMARSDRGFGRWDQAVVGISLERLLRAKALISGSKDRALRNAVDSAIATQRRVSIPPG